MNFKYKFNNVTYFIQRKNGEYDKELMLLTTGILYMNPDVSTVWNIRKEYLLKLENL